MNKKINIGICGVGGYVGQELAQLIIAHPHFNLIVVNARESAAEVGKLPPLFAQHTISVISFAEINQPGCAIIDVLALATPTEVSMELVAKFSNSAVKLIDLSGAFRLPQEEFIHWYGFSHQVPEKLAAAQYGLLPWEVASANGNGIVANPGCYATCALMALLPMIKADLIDEQSIIIDAKSGVSGAGKKANSDLMFCEMANNFFPYKIGKHQHVPEINNALNRYSAKSCRVRLTTHMLPLVRGISMTIYADSKQPLASDQEIANNVSLALAEAYHHYPLVQYGAVNQEQGVNDKSLLSLKTVTGTAKTHISYFVDDGKLLLFSCIDNLLKGAASQAVENINAWYQLPLHSGLLFEEELS
ncbi:MAG: N-acetyl-gamma-glutamyl-phosphate reductase [Gammaproteobacteria bacterium]|nr:N-acetyl-gamma-glutamyl-phosphate reductase [Gammaproteobacteria bacterium]